MLDCSSGDLVLNTDWSKVVEGIETEIDSLQNDISAFDEMSTQACIKKPKEASFYAISDGFMMIKLYSSYYSYAKNNPFRISGEIKFFSDKDKKSKKCKLRFYTFDIGVSCLLSKDGSGFQDVVWDDIVWTSFCSFGYNLDYGTHALTVEKKIVEAAQDISETQPYFNCYHPCFTKRFYTNVPSFAGKQLADKHEEHVLFAVKEFIGTYEDELLGFAKQYTPYLEKFERVANLRRSLYGIKSLRDSMV